MGRERKLKRTQFTRLSESTGFRLAPSTRRVFESMAKTRSCTLRGKTPQETTSLARRCNSASSRNFFHYQHSSSFIHTCNSGRFLAAPCKLPPASRASIYLQTVKHLPRDLLFLWERVSSYLLTKTDDLGGFRPSWVLHRSAVGMR